MASSEDSGLVGSILSLISKNNIRYEGVVYFFDTSDSERTIGLKNAKVYGTEGRRVDGPQIPPRDEVYEYIVFREQDIKTIQIIASPYEIVEEENSGRSSMEHSQSQDVAVAAARVNREAFPMYQPGITVQSMQDHKQEYLHTPVRASHYTTLYSRIVSLNQVQASQVQPSHTVSGPVIQESSLPSPVPMSEHQTSSISWTEEFDFEVMNEKFKKSMEIDDSGTHETKPAYTKDDFFDTISYGSRSQEATYNNRYSGRMGIDAENPGCFQQAPHQDHRGRSARHGYNIHGPLNRGRGYYNNRWRGWG